MPNRNPLPKRFVRIQIVKAGSRPVRFYAPRAAAATTQSDCRWNFYCGTPANSLTPQQAKMFF